MQTQTLTVTLRRKLSFILYLVLFSSWKAQPVTKSNSKHYIKTIVVPLAPQINLFFFYFSTPLPSLPRKDSFSRSVTLVLVHIRASRRDSLHARPLWWILSHFAEASSSHTLLKEQRRTAWNFTHIPSSRRTCVVSLTHRSNGEENMFKQTASEPIKSVIFWRMCVFACVCVHLCDSKHDKDPDAAHLAFVVPSHPEPTSTTARRWINVAFDLVRQQDRIRHFGRNTTNILRQKTNKCLVCLLGKAGFTFCIWKGIGTCSMDEEMERVYS